MMKKSMEEITPTNNVYANGFRDICDKNDIFGVGEIGIREAKEVERKSCWTSYLLVRSIECVIHTDVAFMLGANFFFCTRNRTMLLAYKQCNLDEAQTTRCLLPVYNHYSDSHSYCHKLGSKFFSLLHHHLFTLPNSYCVLFIPFSTWKPFKKSRNSCTNLLSVCSFFLLATSIW